MPTVLVQDGFKFFFYTDEHEPKHVDVSKGDDYAKVELGTLRVSQDFMKPKELSKALAIIKASDQKCEEQWDEWYAKR